MPDYAKWLVSRMISDYEETMEHAKALENEYRKKLENLNVFDSASREFFKSISDDIKKQENLLKEMSKAGTIGEFPAMGISLIADMNREYELSMKDIEGILFYTDAKGNKHISEEGIGLFADVSKENMSKKQLELYNMLISYIYTDECDTKELNTIIHAFYREPVEERLGESKVSVRNLKKAGASFVADLDDKLTEIIKIGEVNNNQVGKAELFRVIFENKKIANIEVSYEEGGNTDSGKFDGYVVKLSTYQMENGTGKYVNGLWQPTKVAALHNEIISIVTLGHGLDGFTNFSKKIQDEQSEEYRNEMEKLGRKIGYDLLTNKINVPMISTLLDVAEAGNYGYKSKVIAQNRYLTDYASLTDAYITQINEDVVLRKGPNTEAICKYLEKQGFSINGTQKENMENIIRYGAKINKDTLVKIRDYVKRELENGGYLWNDN